MAVTPWLQHHHAAMMRKELAWRKTEEQTQIARSEQTAKPSD